MVHADACLSNVKRVPFFRAWPTVAPSGEMYLTFHFQRFPGLAAQDESSCIGCKQCVWCASATFRIEPTHGRSRVFAQWIDDEDLIQVRRCASRQALWYSRGNDVWILVPGNFAVPTMFGCSSATDTAGGKRAPDSQKNMKRAAHCSNLLPFRITLHFVNNGGDCLQGSQLCLDQSSPMVSSWLLVTSPPKGLCAVAHSSIDAHPMDCSWHL